jgi:hypothetical protein
MEATIFTGWIYDHLLPYAEKMKNGAPVDAQSHRRPTRSKPVHADPPIELACHIDMS